MTQSDQAKRAAETAVQRIDPTTVKGWAIDAEPRNDPTWPMRDRTGDPGSRWPRPIVQATEAEILCSVEHRDRPAVVGTLLPPKGVSGALRRAAFRFSESQWGHWLLLMLADRVDVTEGLIEDLTAARIPNPLVETGMVPRAHRHSAALATAAVCVGAAVFLWMRHARQRGM